MSKRALCLYGSYSMWKIVRNESFKMHDLFAVTYDEFQDMEYAFKKCEVFNYLTTKLERMKFQVSVREIEEFKTQGFKLIQQYEADHGFKYDNILFRPFNEVYNNLELISNTHVKEGDKIIPIINHPNASEIYKTIFGDKFQCINSLTIPQIKSDEPVFIISSIIHVTNEKFKGVYTAEERLCEVLDQLRNVKRKCPNCKIIIIEQSHLNVSEIYQLLNAGSDLIVSFINDSTCMRYVNNVIQKSSAEAYAIKAVCKRILHIDVEWIIVLAARYKLLNTFSLKNILNKNRLTIIKYPGNITYTGRPMVCSNIYSIHKTVLQNFIDCIEPIDFDIEHTICRMGELLLDPGEMHVIGTGALSGYINKC